MTARRTDIASCKRLLLVVLDGIHFPNARNALRAAGFAGELRVVTHREWSALCRGQCDALIDFPGADTPKFRLGIALARVFLRETRRTDAVCWVAPPLGVVRRIISCYARYKAHFSFYGGLPSPHQPGREPSLPAMDIRGVEESALAVRYLRPLLGRSAPASPTLRLGIDSDGIQMRAATGVQWYRRHLFAALCHEEFALDLRFTGPVAEARNIWETPWSRRMNGMPPPLFNYVPPTRADAPPIETVTGPIDLFHQTLFDPAPRFLYPKAVATVYDLTPLAVPQYFAGRFMERLEAMAPFWRDECARLICISEATRDDLERILDIPKSRCVVLPPAKHPHFQPPDETEIARVCKRYDLERPYFMALGSIAPHKNFEGLCEAFAIFKRSTGLSHRLVIAGQPGWMLTDVLTRVAKSGVADDVRFIGYVEWGDLPALYGGAEAFCMPSLYEGYGMPVQEAMCCGCPVLLSRRTSLPEVAGDAGLYWNPDDPEDMASCLRRICEEDGLREALRVQVLQHAETFPTWMEVARAHVELYEEVTADA